MGTDKSDSRKISRVVNQTRSGVKLAYNTHFLISEREIENIEIFSHTFFVYGLGNYDHIALVKPTQDNLTYAVLK